METTHAIKTVETEPERPTSFPDIIAGEWRVHLVESGQPYGMGGCLTYSPEAEGKTGADALPLVEFYKVRDRARYETDYFVSRYDMAMLLGLSRYSSGHLAEGGRGLCLDGGTGLAITGEDAVKVARWLDGYAMRHGIEVPSWE